MLIQIILKMQFLYKNILFTHLQKYNSGCDQFFTSFIQKTVCHSWGFASTSFLKSKHSDASLSSTAVSYVASSNELVSKKDDALKRRTQCAHWFEVFGTFRNRDPWPMRAGWGPRSQCEDGPVASWKNRSSVEPAPATRLPDGLTSVYGLAWHKPRSRSSPSWYLLELCDNAE